MYLRSSHRARSVADVHAVMRQHMFATMITPSPEGISASHLPFVLDASRGEHGTLLAHMARANAQSAVVGSAEETLVLFHGPHAYISPSWYADRATAPTWDYIAIHCYGRTRRHSDAEARANIERLIGVVEAHNERPWSISELSEDEIAALLRNVVSFEMPIERFEAKFKLNQGEKPERTLAAIAQLEAQGSNELAQYMRRYLQ